MGKYLAVLFVLFLAAPALAGGKLQPLTDWDSDSGAKTWHVDSATVTLSLQKGKDNAANAMLVASAPGIAEAKFLGTDDFDKANASFGVGRFDPKYPAPQIVFTSYSGGAHCCTQVTLIEPVNGRWKAVDLGSWDGEGLGGIPRDEDGDGTADFVFYDNSFLYTFASYADSDAPPLITNVVGGKAADVSTAPRYAPLFRADMARAQADCAKHSNGACAAYVADGARLGQFDAAWKFMLAHYDPKDDWELPTRCNGPTKDGECKGQELKPKDYPEALRWFLEDNGYIKKS